LAVRKHCSTITDNDTVALPQADAIRDYMREAAPLGAALTTASVEEATPEEEEEEEEEGEDEEEGTTRSWNTMQAESSLVRFCCLAAHLS